MAGIWPDMPSRKIPYHADGTVVAGRYPGLGAPWENFYDWNPIYVEELNDIDFTSIAVDWDDKRFAAGTVSAVQTVWIFPERRDLYGHVVIAHKTGTGTGTRGTIWCEISADTTNGVDGTWVEVSDNEANVNLVTGNPPEGWRTEINYYSYPASRAIRSRSYVRDFFYPGDILWNGFFVFGRISAGETPDRILFIDNTTGLEFDKPMDWGDVPRGTTLDWDIYLKNNSLTLTANTMTLDFTSLYNTSDTWLQIKDTGGSFTDTHAVSSVAANDRYPTGTDVLTVRLDVPDDQPLSIYEAILELSPAVSWT